MTDIETRLRKAGITKLKLEGQGSSNPQYAFPCPFHPSDGRRMTARYSINKHAFYCFAGCVFGHDRHGNPSHGMRGKDFWARLGVNDIGFIDASIDPQQIRIHSYEEFLVPGQDTLEMGEKIFDACDPISRHPAAVEYLTRRLGSNARLPMDCRFHAHSQSLMFWSGYNYVQKYLDGKGRTFGDAHLFTHLEQTEELVLVEGPFDYLATHFAGFPAAAALGISITPLKLQDIRRLGVRRVYFAFDNDAAGQEAGLRIEEKNGQQIAHVGPSLAALEKENLDVRFVPMRAGKKDFGDTPYPHIKEQIDQAMPLADIRLWQLEALLASNPF